MRERRDIFESLPPQAAPAVKEIARGMKLEKCQKCGCMKDALDQAERAFAASDAPEIRSLVPVISGYQAKMKPLAYDCIGCKKCWGADATVALAEHFDEIEIDQCAAENECSCGCSSMAPAPSAGRLTKAPWPPPSGRLRSRQSRGYGSCLLSLQSGSSSPINCGGRIGLGNRGSL